MNAKTDTNIDVQSSINIDKIGPFFPVWHKFLSFQLGTIQFIYGEYILMGSFLIHH